MFEGDVVHDSTAVVANVKDYDRSMASVVAAFICDPFLRWLFPDPWQYLHFTPLLLKHFGGRAFEHSSAYRSSDFKAAAFWLPPGVSPDEEAMGAVLAEGVSPERQGDMFYMLEQVGAGHPKVAHWYLPVIGVEPLSQGRGYGSTRMARGLQTCDLDQVAAYLETTNPANIPLYERFGFDVVGEMQAGSSPVITPMFRAAR
jgi:ribosomal protein S18 acetylase RimI-like enzyme